MWASLILAAALAIFFVLFYRQRRRKMNMFNKIGIPGPKPNFLFGNLLNFWRKPMYCAYRDWCKEYGDTYGYFEGPSPVIVTSDVELLHEVFVKQFKKFHARKIWPVQVDPDNDEMVHMFFARGERWRRLRSITNPAFSTGRMRMMSPMINGQLDNYINAIEEKRLSDEDFNIYDLLQRLTFDTIAKCGFGLNAQSITEPDDEYLEKCRGVITDTTKRPILFMFGFIFPALHRLWISIYYFLGKIQLNPVIWLEEKLQTVIVNRKRHAKSDHPDLLELFLNSEYDPAKADMESLSDSDSLVATMAKHRYLSTEELRSQCLLFLLSGYETTSTTLAYVMYEMAMNQEVQRKLQQEVDRYFPNETDQPSYDNVMKMEYLDMVWCETLRKYPLASTVIARQCTESTEVKGYKIESGMIVQANVWEIHYSPKFWGEDPHTFNPERFTLENKRNRHPMAWMPFGGGPRTCVGLRLAQLEGKMTIVRTLREFNVHAGKTLTSPLKIVEGATIFPKDGVSLRVTRRSDATE